MRAFLLRTVGHPLALLGLAGLLFGAVLIGRTVVFHRRAVLVESEIVNVAPYTGEGGGTLITYTFKDAASRRWRGVGVSEQSARIGDRINVLYDPVDPAHSEFELGWSRQWIPPALLLGLGTGFIVIGWILAGRKLPPPLPPSAR